MATLAHLGDRAFEDGADGGADGGEEWDDDVLFHAMGAVEEDFARETPAKMLAGVFLASNASCELVGPGSSLTLSLIQNQSSPY